MEKYILVYNLGWYTLKINHKINAINFMCILSLLTILMIFQPFFNAYDFVYKKILKIDCIYLTVKYCYLN